MTTQGETLEKALDRLGDRIVEAAEIMAIPVSLAAVALNNVASALYSQPRRPGAVEDMRRWMPGQHTTTMKQ